MWSSCDHSCDHHVIQVTSSEVAYHGGQYSCKGLKPAVEKHIYPPAIHCVVVYSSPPACSWEAKMNKLCIEGTNKEGLSFPFTVYEVKSKWLNWAVRVLLNEIATRYRLIKARSAVLESSAHSNCTFLCSKWHSLCQTFWHVCNSLILLWMIEHTRKHLTIQCNVLPITGFVKHTKLPCMHVYALASMYLYPHSQAFEICGCYVHAI